MIRSLFAAMTMMSLTCVSASSQQGAASATQASPTAPQGVAVFPDRNEALRRIALFEAVARTTPDGDASQVRIYRQLGDLYELVAMYPKAEDAMQREISLLQGAPKDQLAEAVGRLATLHSAMGDLRKAEKDQLQELDLRESEGDPVGIALAQSDLAGLYVKQQHFKKAAELEEKAMDVLRNSTRVAPGDRIAVLQTFGIALCESGNCERGIAQLKDALELAKVTDGANGLGVGFAEFLLGYGYWQGGDMVDAGQWMELGTTRMKADLGWGQPMYVHAMNDYARFLRQRGQPEQAATAEREVRQANSVVDARSFVGR